VTDAELIALASLLNARVAEYTAVSAYRERNQMPLEYLGEYDLICKIEAEINAREEKRNKGTTPIPMPSSGDAS
jgi:hypothetical protein